jgi:hypothetical protein
MLDDRTERLIRQNHLLLAHAATARAASRMTVVRARECIASLRQSQIALARTLFRLQHPRGDSSPSADTFFRC